MWPYGIESGGVHVNFEIICDRWYYHHRSINFCENDFQYVQTFGADALQWNVCCFWSYETYRTIIVATAENQQKKYHNGRLAESEREKIDKIDRICVVKSIYLMYSFPAIAATHFFLHEFLEHIQYRYKRVQTFVSQLNLYQSVKTLWQRTNVSFHSSHFSRIWLLNITLLLLTHHFPQTSQ